MLPMVSRREPPTGHLLTSSASAFLWSQNRRTLLPRSKTESIPVARSDKDSDEMAPYTAPGQWSCQDKEGRLTLQDTEAQVSEETRPDRDSNLGTIR